ncbi:MAG: DNA replication/repair protein RecF [Calditrichaceae bacterium]|jgi:DNA replication and repair protein RecF
MKLNNISITNFRNIEKQNIEFDTKLNIFYGENGQGKTSVLEAIYLLAISKSFRVKSEKIVLQFHKDFFDINGNFTNEEDRKIKIRVYFSLENGKNIFLNENKLKKYSEIIGITPVILLSLEDLELTYGVPSNRRKFIDILISQVSPLYLHALQNYKRSILQRNKHLNLIYEKKESIKSLFPWDEQVIQHGSEIITYRLKLIEYINKSISDNYRIISDKNENIKVEYKSRITNKLENISSNKIKQRFNELLKSELNTDLQKQSSSIGPHRDDIQFFMNDNLIKSFGSQGENKTFLIALKFLEADYIKNKTKTDPIFLMDDIFGELDSKRIEKLTEYVSTFGQTFITTVSKGKFSESKINNINFINIKNGCVIQ